jgi:hypothetical protein
MRKLYVVTAVLICLSGFTNAQTSNTSLSSSLPKFEVFGGYAYTHLASGGGLNYNGWEGSASWNFNRWLAAKADFGGQYYSNETPEISFDTPFGPITLPATTFHESVHTFMAGPEISYRGSKWKVFGHGLIGAAHSHESVDIHNPPPGFVIGNLSLGDTGFAAALGGGGDWMFGKRFGWRVMQADYLLERANSSNRNNIRISTGVVFHFGQK